MLKIVAERAGIGKTQLPPNTGIGVACVSAQEKKTPTWTATERWTRSPTWAHDPTSACESTSVPRPIQAPTLT